MAAEQLGFGPACVYILMYTSDIGGCILSAAVGTVLTSACTLEVLAAATYPHLYRVLDCRSVMAYWKMSVRRWCTTHVCKRPWTVPCLATMQLSLHMDRWVCHGLQQHIGQHAVISTALPAAPVTAHSTAFPWAEGHHTVMHTRAHSYATSCSTSCALVMPTR